MAGPASVEKNLEAIGLPALVASSFVEEKTPVFPENWLAYQVFCAMRTQWRVGMTGPVGLDYQAMECTMRLMEVPKKKRPDLFWAVQVMERELLSAWSERKD